MLFHMFLSILDITKFYVSISNAYDEESHVEYPIQIESI